MQPMLINIDCKSALQIDKCVCQTSGNMVRIKYSSAEELTIVTTYQTLRKFRFYYSAGTKGGKSG